MWSQLAFTPTTNNVISIVFHTNKQKCGLNCLSHQQLIMWSQLSFIVQQVEMWSQLSFIPTTTNNVVSIVFHTNKQKCGPQLPFISTTNNGSQLTFIPKSRNVVSIVFHTNKQKCGLNCLLYQQLIMGSQLSFIPTSRNVVSIVFHTNN